MTETLDPQVLGHAAQPHPLPCNEAVRKGRQQVEELFQAFLGKEALFTTSSSQQRKIFHPVPPRPGSGHGSGPIPLGAPGDPNAIDEEGGEERRKVNEVAAELKKMGDTVNRKHGPRIEAMGKQVTLFVVENAVRLTYDGLRARLNELMENGDIDATNLVIMMEVGKRVITATTTACGKVREYYGQFMGEKFGERVSQVEDMGEFIKGAASSV